ncbi:MAG: zinc ribbon domain-containing protein [Clostridia bacterium]|nr:zinc ribbon domain-containing protein [Clostridia bacterium]
MYCKHCGQEISDNVNFCPICGGAINSQTPTQPQQPVNTNPNPDKPSGVYAFWSFIFPLIGLFLFLMWRDQFPLRAKSAGGGALASVVFSIILTFVIIIVALVTVSINAKIS